MIAKTELQGVPLGGILTSVLQAAIDAQSSAGMEVVQFITTYAFKKRQTDLQDPTGGTKGASDFGEMVNVSVRYNERSSTGLLVPAVLKMPLLTMLTIPCLYLEEMTMSFKARITSVQSKELGTYRENNNSSSTIATDDAPAPVNRSNGRTHSVLFGTQIVKSRRSKSSNSAEVTKREYSLSLTVKATGADMPVGLERVMIHLESAFSLQPVGLPTLPSAATLPPGAPPVRT